ERQRRHRRLCESLVPARATKLERVVRQINARHTPACARVACEPREVAARAATRIEDCTVTSCRTERIKQCSSDRAHACEPPEALFQRVQVLVIFRLHSILRAP